MDLLCRYNTEQEVTGFLLELLIHCLPVHNVIACAFERNKLPYLRKLLPYVKYCANQTGFCCWKNSALCEKETKTEMANRNMSCQSRAMVQSVVSFLQSFSTDFFCHQLHSEDIATVPFDGELKVAFLHRRANRVWRDPIPCSIHGFHLLIVFVEKKHERYGVLSVK